MRSNLKSLKAHLLFLALTCLALAAYSTQAWSWGRDGHTAIGIMAISQLPPETLQQLEAFIQPLTRQAMAQACSWPDDYREAEEGEWSGPLHYINIPRGDELYTASRDCPIQPNPEGRPARYCATEAIKYYAAELSAPRLSPERRWRSFAWLCHLVADLHQPMHASFADDRGGNDVKVVYGDWHMNLHRFWDSALIDRKAGSWQYLVGQLSEFPPVQARSGWTPSMVNDWTNRSHQLAKEYAYPASANIDEAFAQQSWDLLQEQIRLAASHLALILNSVLKPGFDHTTGGSE